MKKPEKGTEEYKKWFSDIRKEAALKMYKDNPELIEKRREEALKRYENTEEREKTGKKAKEYWSCEDNRISQRQRQLRFIERNPGIGNIKKQIAIDYWQDEEARKLKSVQMKEKFSIISNHPRWEGGKSFEPYSIEWNEEFKEYIRNRQNYICADIELGNCSKYKISLHVHHIDRNKKNTTPENCIALCGSHHHKSHNIIAQHRHKEFIKALMENNKD